jgi:hypothetical protein
MNDMEKKIAIQGHEKRGAEVIKALEELGGRNIHSLSGESEANIYFIGNNNEIHYTYFTIKDIDRYYQIYTLEEYLKQTEQINNKTQRQLSVDIKTAKQWYKTNNETLKQLALSLFTEEELTRIELPTSWKEFCNKYPSINNEWYVNTISHIDTFKKGDRNSYADKNHLETQEDAEAILALIQLKRLRDFWWKVLNYQPNWANEEEKYCIGICKNKIKLETKIFSSTFLAFPTQDIRNQFFVSFQDLIRKAIPFLS